MPKISKKDYESQEAKDLKLQLKQQLTEDRNIALAKNALARIPEDRQVYVFRLLSEKFATK